MEALHVAISLWLRPYHLFEMLFFRARCWWRGLEFVHVRPVLRLYQRRQVILASIWLTHTLCPGEAPLGPLYTECKRKNAVAKEVLDLV